MPWLYTVVRNTVLDKLTTFIGKVFEDVGGDTCVYLVLRVPAAAVPVFAAAGPSMVQHLRIPIEPSALQALIGLVDESESESLQVLILVGRKLTGGEMLDM